MNWTPKTVTKVTLIALGMTLGMPSRAQQSEFTPLSDKALPSLSDTIAFLNRSVTLDDSFIASEQEPCNIEVVRNEPRTFVLPESTYVKNVDAYGIKHYGFKYAIIREPGPFMWVPLSTIDPESVNSKVSLAPSL